MLAILARVMTGTSATAANASASSPKILIVVVNFRTADLTIDCLASLDPEVRSVGNCHVVVVDNHSEDGSAARIRAAVDERGWGDWAEFVESGRNGGFAFGNNVALRPCFVESERARPDYVLLLNPDTIVRPGAVSALLEFLEAHPEVGIAGSRLEWEDGTQHQSRYRFPTVLSEFDAGFRLSYVSKLLSRYVTAPPLRLEEHPIDWVAGASMMVRRKVFEDIGLLDEGYFLYYEETDFCLRARRAGWPCYYVPRSRVAHLVGRSSGVTNTLEPRKRTPRYWFESRRRYFVKNHGRAYFVLTNLAWAGGNCAWTVRRWIQRKPPMDAPHYLSDFVRFNFAPHALAPLER